MILNLLRWKSITPSRFSALSERESEALSTARKSASPSRVKGTVNS